MKGFIVLPVLAGITTFTTTAAGTAPSGRAERRVRLGERTILGGTPTDAEDYSFFVRGEYGCGAALIAPDVVLGAAHCKDHYGSNVLVGSHSRTGALQGLAQYRKVRSDKIVHPTFNYTSNGFISHDLVMFRIQAVKGIQPVQFNTDASRPTSAEPLVAIGYGYTAANGSESPFLLQASVHAINTTTCEQLYNRKPGIFDDSVMCTMGDEATTCYGDSGGPIVDREQRLVGVISFGTKSCDPRYPAGSMNVAKASDWIEEQVCKLTGTYQPYCQCRAASECARLAEQACPCRMGLRKRRQCVLRTVGQRCCSADNSDYVRSVWSSGRARCRKKF